MYGGVGRQFQTAHGEQIPSVKIIHKYVLREHAGPLVFALSALTSLLLLNYIAKQFGNLVGKGLPWAVIGQFFGLSVPFTLAMTLPMAVLVSTLYAFSRLAAENEVTALKANGVRIMRGGAFKPRTSPYSFQGLGEQGLQMLRAVGDRGEELELRRTGVHGVERLGGRSNSGHDS